MPDNIGSPGSQPGVIDAIAGGLGLNGPGDQATQDALRNGQKYNYLGNSPYQSQWNTLLTQLHQTALGQGPSLAGMAYRQAAQNGQQAEIAMSRGRSAGAARAGALGLAQQQQGYAQGYGVARTTEEMQANQAYQQALAAADQSQFGRDQSNQNAYLQAMHNASGMQSSTQKLLGAAGQVASIVGVAGGGAAKSGAPQQQSQPTVQYPQSQPQGIQQTPYQQQNDAYDNYMNQVDSFLNRGY